MNIEAICWAYEGSLPPTIKGSAHAVLIALCYSLNYKTRQCNPSMHRLAELTHHDISTVKKAIRILKSENLIRLSSGKRLRKSNQYVINYERVKMCAHTKPVASTDSSQVKDEFQASAKIDDGVNSTLIKDEKPSTETISQLVNSNLVSLQSSSADSIPPPPKKDSAMIKVAKEVTLSDCEPIGIEEAYTFVRERIDGMINWDEFFANDAGYQEEVIEILASMLAFYKRPTDIQLKQIINVIATDLDYNWISAEIVANNIADAIEEGRRIFDIHKYVVQSLKNQAKLESE